MSWLQLVRDLWPALVGLYLAEGGWWVGGGAVVGRRAGGRFRRRAGGLRWAVATPLDEVWAVGREPLAVGAGIYLPFPDAAPPGAAFRRDDHELVPWNEVDATVEGAAVRVGRRRLAMASAGAAHQLAGDWRRWRDLPPAARAAEVAARRSEAWDPGVLARRRERAAVETATVRWTGVALALLLLVALPVAAWGPSARGVVVVLGLAAALWLGQVALVVRTRRRLRASGVALGPGVVATAALSPPAAALAGPALCRDLARGLEPLAVTAAVAAGEDLATRLGRELWGSRCAAADPAAEPEWRAAWSERAATLARFAGGRGLADVELGLTPPSSPDVAVCPLCGGEFSSDVERCLECRLPLLGPAPGPAVSRP